MIYIFLPAYNEELALPRLVKKFGEEMKKASEAYQIVVLDDGSSDATVKTAERLATDYPVKLLRHEVNRGLGETMRDGLDYIADVSKDGDFVVTLDCDDTHEPHFVHAALEKARQGADIVVLSRYCEGGGEEGLSAFRSVLSRGAGIFLKLFFPLKNVQEYSCGYRVFRASILKKAARVFGKKFIELTHMGFVVTPEILIKLRMLGASVVESPFVLKYDQKPTASKNRPLKTIQGYFALIALCWGRRVKLF